MTQMNTIKTCLPLLAFLPWAAGAQDQGPAIQKKLESEYKLTKTMDDKSDIVTAGDVILLHKDKILMIAATSSANPCMNTYRGGQITQPAACKIGTSKITGAFAKHLNLDKAPATRNFVSGEKFWVTKIDVSGAGKEPGIVFNFFTDAISDVRYRGVLTIPFGALTPTPDEALKLVSEVITVAPAEDDDKSKKSAPPDNPKGTPAPLTNPAPAPATPAVTEAAPPPLDAPPPPAADPVEVKEGQTPAQVIAALGQPLKKATIGAKQIYTYKDMKITFVNGAVKDVQ